MMITLYLFDATPAPLPAPRQARAAEEAMAMNTTRDLQAATRYDEWLASPPDQVYICDKCGRQSAGDCCGQCGLSLCSMCLESGGGVCSEHSDEDLEDDYPYDDYGMIPKWEEPKESLLDKVQWRWDYWWGFKWYHLFRFLSRAWQRCPDCRRLELMAWQRVGEHEGCIPF